MALTATTFYNFCDNSGRRLVAVQRGAVRGVRIYTGRELGARDKPLKRRIDRLDTTHVVDDLHDDLEPPLPPQPVRKLVGHGREVESVIALQIGRSICRRDGRHAECEHERERAQRAYEASIQVHWRTLQAGCTEDARYVALPRVMVALGELFLKNVIFVAICIWQPR